MDWLDGLGEFDSVLDVGGNVGDFAAACFGWWPRATITSFEPLPGAAGASAQRANGCWLVEQLAVSSRDGTATLHYCVNQHSASTMQQVGDVRQRDFGIHDRHEPVDVRTVRLDSYIHQHPDRVPGRLLVKVDVEGHEGHVLAGAEDALTLAAVAVVEVQQDPHIFLGSPTPAQVNQALLRLGLTFAGVLSAFNAPDGRLIQFDGLWRRERFS